MILLFFDGISPFFQIFIFFITFFVVVILLSVYYNWAFKRESVKKSNSLGTYQYLIDDEGIKVTSPQGFSFWEWREVKKIKTSKNIIAIESFKYGTILLPKKFFENEDTLDETLSFMTGKVKEI